MRVALSSGDTNTARALLPPDFRGDPQSPLSMISTFARPLGWKSSIRISGSSARVCPELYFLVPRWPPEGHTIPMVKVDGEWYFTGAVHID
jgi:hypothetical protein